MVNVVFFDGHVRTWRRSLTPGNVRRLDRARHIAIHGVAIGMESSLLR